MFEKLKNFVSNVVEKIKEVLAPIVEKVKGFLNRGDNDTAVLNADAAAATK